jgi:hypothetical protein
MMYRDSPDGRRVERISASIWFPLQGEAVALSVARDMSGLGSARYDEMGVCAGEKKVA